MTNFNVLNILRCVSFFFSADIELDSGFKDFYKWCKTNEVPFVIVSRYVRFSFSFGEK